MDILSQIVEDKKIEVQKMLSEESHLMTDKLPISEVNLYSEIDKTKSENQPFFITEFKRKSPSAGIIEKNLKPIDQANRYISIGANAISVLTDTKYFGGTFEDLKEVTALAREKNTNVCVLQKDFVIHPIQVYKARSCGANMILLIARILTPEKLQELKALSESLGMGCLVEVHDADEYRKIQHLKIEVLGINNRNLATFKTRLNHFYTTINEIDYNGHLIAESGIYNAIDYKMLSKRASGYLIGQSLMEAKPEFSLSKHFETDKKWIFKACGLRTKEQIASCPSDLIGINFSPISKRIIDRKELENIPDNAVAVFKENNEQEILEIVTTFGFKYVQLYLKDLTTSLLNKLKCKIILATTVKSESDLKELSKYSSDCDLFILDGAVPGSGESIDITIPDSFSYPFLLAGGMNKDNLKKLKNHPYCIGVDMASGIEIKGTPTLSLMEEIKEELC